MPKTLDLDDAPEVRVYDVLVEQILAAGLPIRRLVTWYGDVDDDDRLFGTAGAEMRLYPCSDPEAARWTYPGLKKVRMTVGVEFAVDSGDIRDVLNLWHAVRKAFFPQDAAGFVSLQTRLRDAGVEDGQVMFAQGADIAADANKPVGSAWNAIGKLACDVSISVSHA